MNRPTELESRLRFLVAETTSLTTRISCQIPRKKGLGSQLTRMMHILRLTTNRRCQSCEYHAEWSR